MKKPDFNKEFSNPHSVPTNGSDNIKSPQTGTGGSKISKQFQSGKKIEELLLENMELIVQNQQYQKTIKDLHRLFSIISHDLRSPIDIISGTLMASSESSFSKQERLEIDAELLNRVNATSELITNLLTWSKTQIEGIVPHLTTIKLADALHNSLYNLTLKAEKKGITLSNDIGKDVEVISDKDMLLIVFRNIVNNAVKFTPTGGIIDVKLIEKDDAVIIAIKDNGIGIASGRKSEILSLSLTSTYGTNGEAGVGLGLKLCQEFMEYLHGKIWFESEEGKGTTFYISIPSIG